MCLRIPGAALPLGRLCPVFAHSAFFLHLSRFGGFEVALRGFVRPFCIPHYSFRIPSKLDRVSIVSQWGHR